MKDFTVIGSGIIGLTTAVALQEKGATVKLITAELPEKTLSHKVGAIWYPYDVFPIDKANIWATSAYKRYEQEADISPGVSFLDFMVVSSEGDDHSWTKKLPKEAVRFATKNELPGGANFAHIAKVPLAEPPKYLPFLLNSFLQNGGKIEQHTFKSLAELAKSGETVINCTGLGARDLCNDETLIPMRGQILRAAWMDVPAYVNSTEKNKLSYIIRRSEDCILGGTDYDNDWNLDEMKEDTELILNRISNAGVLKQKPVILETLVGLRPKRPAIRFEWDTDFPNVFHNYGHGGSGFTVGWGCAIDLAEQLTRE